MHPSIDRSIYQSMRIVSSVKTAAKPPVQGGPITEAGTSFRSYEYISIGQSSDEIDRHLHKHASCNYCFYHLQSSVSALHAWASVNGSTPTLYPPPLPPHPHPPSVFKREQARPGLNDMPVVVQFPTCCHPIPRKQSREFALTSREHCK